MDYPFLSIIVPTFNNSKDDISRCLQSIMNDIFINYEILIIDDGSQAEFSSYLDNLKICSQLRVYHIQHAGVSSARNFGVTESKGTYICFVDADDIVTNQFWCDIQRFYLHRDFSFEIIYGLVRSITKVNLSSAISKASACSKIKCDELLRTLDIWEKQKLYGHFFALGEKCMFSNDIGYLSRGPVARIVRRDLALKCFFDSDLSIGEDMIWNLKILKLDPKAGYISHIWYFYVLNLDSVTHAYNEKLVDSYKIMIARLFEYTSPDFQEEFKSKVFETLKEVAVNYFLTPSNSKSWWQKVKEFNKMSYSYPYNAINNLNSFSNMGG